MAVRKKKTTKASNTDSVLAVFEFVKSTKNTHRMQEVNSKGEPIGAEEGAAIGSLYLQKSKFGSEAPKKVRVEVTTF